MNLIQILILLFIAYVLYRLFIKLKQRELSTQVLILWLVFWVAVAIIVILPQSLGYIAVKVGVGRGVDVAIYVSILVLFYIAFRVFVRLEKIEKNMTEIVRRVSINNAEHEIIKKQTDKE